MILYVENQFNSIKHLKFEAKIISNDSENEYYYRKLFYNYDDALDVCNTEYFKIKDKNKYIKKIELIK